LNGKKAKNMKIERAKSESRENHTWVLDHQKKEIQSMRKSMD
jgi:hypothetical protein